MMSLQETTHHSYLSDSPNHLADLAVYISDVNELVGKHRSDILTFEKKETGGERQRRWSEKCRKLAMALGR